MESSRSPSRSPLEGLADHIFPDVKRKLQASYNQVNSIRAATGNAGLSVGILYRGQAIHQAHYGHRDDTSKKTADSDTQYHVAAMSETIAVLCFSILEHDGMGELVEVTALKEIVPEWAAASTIRPETKSRAHVLDIKAHRTGLEQRDLYRLQIGGRFLMESKDMHEIIHSLRHSLVNGFRTKLTYNECALSILDSVAKHRTGKSLQWNIQELVLGPVNLISTSMGRFSTKNHVTSYMALSDGTVIAVPHPEEGQVQIPQTFVKSSINDLIILVRALLRSYAEAIECENKKEFRGVPLYRQPRSGPFLGDVIGMWEPRKDIDDDAQFGVGWVATDLPCKGGALGQNAQDAESRPIIGKGVKEQRLVYRLGSTVGTSSAVYLLPDSETAVVVLSNSFDLGDTADWVAQYLLEILVEAPDPNDYVELARKTAQNCVRQAEQINESLEHERILNTRCKKLSAYAGRYKSDCSDFYIDIASHKKGLRMTLQGFDNAYFDIYHYHNDVFAWRSDRDAMARKAMLPVKFPSFYKIKFEAETKPGPITSLCWTLDEGDEGGNRFVREPPKEPPRWRQQFQSIVGRVLSRGS